MSKEIIFPLLKQGKSDILSVFNAVPDDKLDWKPFDNGRTVLDLFGEAAQTPALLTAFAKGKGEVALDYELAGKYVNRDERGGWSKEDALAAFEANHAAMLELIESFSEEDLSTQITVEMGGGSTNPLSVWILMVYRTYVSRFAQINYVQTLYGDFKYHNF